MMSRAVKRPVRLSPAMPKMVRQALGSRLMLGYVAVSAAYYALLLVSNLGGNSDLFLSLALILAQGFVTAESVILYQRKESANLKHLSLFCLIGMIVMFMLCLFLGLVVVSLNMEYSAQTEEILQLWADADLASGMPYMIATVASAGLLGLSLLFLWKALGMCADWLEYRGQARNWFLPAAVSLALYAGLNLTLTILQPGSALGTAANVVSFLRDGLLVILLARAAVEYKAAMG